MSDLIVKPEVVEAREKAFKAQKNAERRRIALELGKYMTSYPSGSPTGFWKEMLGYADALIELTSDDK
jgi:hypothetical protein